MKITYDKKIDAMYLQFQTGSFSRNKEIEEGIILDIGRGNKILGIEILNASRRVKEYWLKILLRKIKLSVRLFFVYE